MSRTPSRVPSRISWDDLRYVLAVAGEGSLAAAARLLGVNHTTVLRRVNAFEERLGLRLFDRLPTGYFLTPAGAELIEAARLMEDAVATLERRLTGQDRRLAGAVRVTTTDTLADMMLPPIVGAFRAKHPGIQIELILSNLVLDLGKHAADVAIRPADNPPAGLVGRRVASIAFAIYAGRDYPVRCGKVEDLSAHPWVAPSDDLGDISVARWMRVAVPNVDIAFKANSLLTLRQAAAANLGLAPLPCYLGDRASELVRVHPPVAAMTTALWVLLHEDLRRSARIRAFTSFVAAEIARQRPLIEGRSPMIASNERSLS